MPVLKGELDKLKTKVSNVAQKVFDTLPNDDEVLDVVGSAMMKMAPLIGKIDKESGLMMADWGKILKKDDQKPSVISEVLSNIEKIADKLKKGASIFDKLKDFLISAVELIQSVEKGSKEISKSFDKFTKATKDLGEAVKKSVKKTVAAIPAR